LVGKNKGKILGMITGLVPQSSQVYHNSRIFFLYPIDGEFARKGLTVMLLNAFIKEVKKRLPKASYIDVIVNPQSVTYVALYSLNGFVINGFVQGYLDSPDQVFLRGQLREK
jgi:ribosomal protein S18 acetylase RimI-like enzyme